MRRLTAHKDRVTIYDVARHAGVAISTVSRVLNESQHVSEEKRRQVHQAIEELQFRPDRTARTLARRSGRPLAVAMPTYATPFNVELLKGIRDTLRGHDADLLLCDLGWQQSQAALLRFLRRGVVEGLLLAGIEVNPPLARELAALHAPTVLIGHAHDVLDAFHWDEAAAARQAVDHLIAQGHRRIGMICAHTERDGRSARLRGYREALDAAGLPFHPDLVASGTTTKHAGFSEEAGYEAMQRLLAAATPVTAVFASSDVQALGAWKAAADAGKQVPDDLAIVGYGNIKTSRFIDLTSVDLDVRAVGQRAAETLVRRLVPHQAPLPRYAECVPTHLVIRRSSTRLRAA